MCFTSCTAAGGEAWAVKTAMDLTRHNWEEVIVRLPGVHNNSPDFPSLLLLKVAFRLMKAPRPVASEN